MSDRLDRYAGSGRSGRVFGLSANTASFGLRGLAISLVLAVAPAILLWTFRHAGFVSDDRWFAFGTLHEAGHSLLTSRWPHPFGPASAYRPVVILSYELTRWLTPGTPLWFHLGNFALHGINAALLAAIVGRLSRSALTGLLAGVILVVHPSTHESVLWISGRTYPIEAFFALTLILWTVTSSGARRPWMQHGIGLLLLAAAFCSYEMAVTLPLILFFIYLAGAAGTFRERVLAAARFAAPYFALLVAYLILRWWLISPLQGDTIVWRYGTNPGAALINPRRRLFNNAIRLAGRMLDVTYSGEWLRLGGTWPMLFPGALVAVALGAATRARELRWLAWGAILCGAIAFLPVVTGTGYNDRMTYLTVAGFAASVAFGMHAFWQHTSSPSLRLRLSRAVGITLLALSLIFWAVQYREKGAEWQHAGDLADRILDQIVAQAPTPSPHASIQVINVPPVYRSAYVYITYFHYALRVRYGRDDLDIVVYPDQPLQTVIDRLGTPSRETVLFRWDEASEQMRLVWRDHGETR